MHYQGNKVLIPTDLLKAMWIFLFYILKMYTCRIYTVDSIILMLFKGMDFNKYIILRVEHKYYIEINQV